MQKRATLGLLLLAPALRAWSQERARLRRIGLLHVGNDHVPPSYRPFLEGLRESGHVEGRTISVDFRNAADEHAALLAARHFVAAGFDAVVAFDNEACMAAHEAGGLLPVVMIHAANPVANGFAASLARPGGRMTGFAGRAELPAKEIEILREMRPKLSRIVLLHDSRDPGSAGWRADAQGAARRFGITLVEHDVPDPGQLRAVLARLKPGEAEAVVFASNVIRHRYQGAVLEPAAKLGMAMVGSRGDVVEKGALFSYSYDFAKVGKAAASRYLDRILKGAKPGELPIEEVTEYELVINAGVARRLGWTLPQGVLLRAERVIE